MVTDPRSNTKTWITTYWIASNITKDDGVTLATTACMYAYPDYPLTLEFKGLPSVDGLILIHEPNSTPLTGHDQYIVGYQEHVDIELVCTDKIGITGTKLLWKMQAELRRIFENYPLGSLRTSGTVKPSTERFGSTILYSVIHRLEYRRGTT